MSLTQVVFCDFAWVEDIFCTSMELDNIPSLDWEEWRDIPWYEWYYMVSSMWRVISLYFKNWVSFRKRIILKKQSNYRWWYKRVGIMWTTKPVHRLVASAFLWLDLSIKHDTKYWMCVCHKNDIRDDNRVENLFLWTRWDNVRDMFSKWRQQKFPKWKDHHLYWKPWWLLWKFWEDNHLSKKVIQLDSKWEVIKEYVSARYASLETWISKVWIWLCCRWKWKSAWWYKWIFSSNKS